MNTNVTSLPSANRENGAPTSNQSGYLAIGLIVLAIIAFIFWRASPAYEPFTITDGQGINAHVSYSQSIDLAEQNNIPLVFGNRWDGPRISYDGARALEDTLDANQITVLVKPGDSFDRNGVYHPAGSAFVGDDGMTLEQRARQTPMQSPVGN